MTKKGRLDKFVMTSSRWNAKHRTAGHAKLIQHFFILSLSIILYHSVVRNMKMQLNIGYYDINIFSVFIIYLFVISHKILVILKDSEWNSRVRR